MYKSVYFVQRYAFLFADFVSCRFVFRGLRHGAVAVCVGSWVMAEEDRARERAASMPLEDVLSDVDVLGMARATVRRDQYTVVGAREHRVLHRARGY